MISIKKSDIAGSTDTPPPLHFHWKRKKGCIPLFSSCQRVEEAQESDECEDSGDAQSDSQPSFHESYLWLRILIIDKI
jgi:hypothetical protein